MDDRRRRVGLGVTLGWAAALAGCVTIGRPLPEPFPRPVEDRARALAQAGAIPLVPVPAPPLGRPEAAGAATGVAARPDAGRTPPPPVPLPADGTPPAVASPARPAEPAPTARQLVQNAQTRYGKVDSYIVRLTRRELVKEKVNPDEVMLFKFRKQPWSVYFKWLGKESQGREVVYVRGKYEGKIHTLLAAGDVPFMPAGKRMSLAPDNILVRSSTRHPITEAGIGASVDRLGVLVGATERGDRRQGTLKVAGPLNRAEFDRPVYALEHSLPAGLDPSLPRGGQRVYFFHPENQLPTLIVARDERGREVEYYRYDRLQADVKLDDDDFDPERLWSKPAAPPTPGR